MGSRGNIRFGRRSVPDIPETAFAFLVRAVAGLGGGLHEGAGSTCGKGIGFSKPSLPRVGGADSALVMGAGLSSVPLVGIKDDWAVISIHLFHESKKCRTRKVC